MTLEQAWTAAEAALPKGAVMEVGNSPDGTYWANCIRENHDGANGFRPFVRAATLIEALNALAQELRREAMEPIRHLLGFGGL